MRQWTISNFSVKEIGIKKNWWAFERSIETIWKCKIWSMSTLVVIKLENNLLKSSKSQCNNIHPFMIQKITQIQGWQKTCRGLSFSQGRVGMEKDYFKAGKIGARNHCFRGKNTNTVNETLKRWVSSVRREKEERERERACQLWNNLIRLGCHSFFLGRHFQTKKEVNTCFY